jgi:Tol biopolymer transport system component
MVFASGRMGDYDIFSLDLDIKHLAQLTTGNNWNDYPRLSPDRSRIAFVSNRGGKSEVWVMDADGKDPQSVVTGGFPSWSPEGTQLTFVSYRDSQAEVCTVDLATGKTTRITHDPGFDGYPDWSPDGKKLAYSSHRGDKQDIYIYDMDSGTEARLTVNPGLDSAPAWSPDGTRIAFVSERPNDNSDLGFLDQVWDHFFGSEDLDIWIMDIGSKDILQVTRGGGVDRHVRWSPDGKQLVYTNSMANSSKSRLMTYDLASASSSPLKIDRGPMNAEIQKDALINDPEKWDRYKMPISLPGTDALARRHAQAALNRTHYAVERHLDWR